MLRRIVASLILAGSVLIPTGHLFAGTASASNSFVFMATCPGFGTVPVLVNGNGATGHVVGTHLIGVALGFRGNAGAALDGQLVSCSSDIGPIDVLFPAGR